MEDIKVSVVMPCLNAKEFIGEAIESILHQTLREIELLVVDAGSSDGTLDIIEAYRAQDGRIRLLHSDKKSMGYQYNMGIEYAKGNYIGFVESDDVIHAEMYEKLFIRAKQAQLDFIKSDFDMFTGSGEERLLLHYAVLTPGQKELYEKVVDPAEHPEFMYRDINMWNGLYARSFLLKQDIKLNTTAGAAFQDTGFVLKSFMNARKIMYLKNPSYYYRKDNANASVYQHEKHLRFVMDEFRFIWEYMKEKEIKEPFRAVVFKRCYDMFCGFYDYAEFHGSGEAAFQSEALTFLQYVQQCYGELAYSEVRAEKLDTSLSLSLTGNAADFRLGRKFIDAIERKTKIDFYKHIKNRWLVIVGTGEWGRTIYAFFQRNRIKTALCFCDAAAETGKEKIMGKNCLLPDMLKTQYSEKLSEIIFILAAESHAAELYKKLRQIGIKAENMIQAVYIRPHEALELEMEEFASER